MHGMMRAERVWVGSRLSRIARVALAAACLSTAALPALAADTDLVVLTNGDRLHGEVKGLRFGRLELTTSATGTIYVEWDKVAALVAPEYFEVETTNGARYYGNLVSGDAGALHVELEGQATPLSLALVVRIRPLKSSFWDRLDGAISLGASYTKSSAIGQGSLSVDIGTRRPRFEFSTSFDTTITLQGDEPAQSRAVLAFSYVRMLPDRYYVPVTLRFEQNTSLGLDLRSSVSGGLGRWFIQSNRSLLGAGGGLLLNREKPVDGDTTDNVEAFFGASYEFFTYDTPKTNISTSFLVYPSLSVSGRYRTELDVNLKREIVKDFTIGLTVYDSFDSKPPAGGTSKNDVGFSLSVGWTF